MDRKQRIISILSILITISCSIYLICIPGEEKSTFLFGYSAKRIILLAFFLITGLIQIYVASIHENHHLKERVKTFNQQLKSKKILLFILGILLVASWYFTFLPINNFPGNQAIFERLKPIIVWIFLQVLVWFYRWNEPTVKENIKPSTYKKELIPSILFVLIAGIIWIIITQTNSGLEKDFFWDSLGVPFTITQVIAAVLILVIFRSTIGEKFGSSKNIDTVLFIVLWVVAACLWIAAPQQTSTFNPGPFLPNGEFYPNSDAETYDACAYTAMQGQPYCAFAENAVSKPVYTVFLFFLHLISGNNYEVLINLQVIFIALLPALVYMIGKELHSRFTGLLAALLIIIKINNSIVHSLIIWTVSHPKFMMSEPFLSVFLVLLCLFMIKWSRDPQGKHIYLYLSAAILGLSTLIRDNVWALLPIFMIVIFIRSQGNFWKKLFHFAQFGFICLLIIVPWAIRNISYGLTPITAWSSLQHVIFENRYGIDTDQQSYELNEQQMISASFELSREPVRSFRMEKNNNVGVADTMYWHDNSSSIHKEVSSSSADSGKIQQSSKFNTIISSTVNHLLHNFLAIFLSLPMTFQTGSVEDLISTTWKISPWTRTWDGTLDIQAFFLIAVNLLIVSMGIFAFRKKGKREYLIPVLILLTYLAGVAFAKTSGGRYIVPVDWIVPLFYASGLVYILDSVNPQKDIGWIENNVEEDHNKNKGKSQKPALFFLVFFFAVSVVLPLTEKIYPSMEFTETYMEFLNSITMAGNSDFSSPFTTMQVEEFLAQDNAVFLSGQALYPKVLDPEDDSATEFFPAQIQQPYSLAFTLLDGKHKDSIFIPIDSAQITFPHGITASILGCRVEDDLVKAKAVILGNGEFIFYARDLSPLICEE